MQVHPELHCPQVQGLRQALRGLPSSKTHRVADQPADGRHFAELRDVQLHRGRWKSL